jgi:hypothetical protein
LPLVFTAEICFGNTGISATKQKKTKLQKYFNVKSRYPDEDNGDSMFQKIVISLVIFTVLIAGCTTTPAPAKGTLQFSSSPSGAQIYLDNQFEGTTPSTMTNVEPGPHTLEFRYSGYQNWHSPITVPSGSSTYYAALTPSSRQSAPAAGVVTTEIPSAQAPVTLQVEKDLMIIGNSQLFSGTGAPNQNVLLVLYGPGKYANGVQVIQASVGADGHWYYQWNPGYSLVSGSYTMVVSDAGKTTSARAGFSVVGGGKVSVATGRYSYGRGDPVAISGTCTTGSQNVILTLYGPAEFTNGVSLGAQTVNADNSWSYQYRTSIGMPVGTYTISVKDAQGTASGSASFSLTT